MIKKPYHPHNNLRCKYPLGLLRFIYINIYIEGVLSKATLVQWKLISQKKEKQQYIAVGTVRISIAPSAKH